MSRFFSVGPFPFGVVAGFGAAFFAAIFVAVALLGVVFLEVAFLLISAPELALDRSTRFRVWRKRVREVNGSAGVFRENVASPPPKLISSANRGRTANSDAAARRGH